ncbi:MAG: HNH endonuclease [Bacteroidota bacterium]
MRPLDKGTGAASGYTPRTNIQFAGNNAPIMTRIFGTSNPLTTDCLMLLLYRVKSMAFTTVQPVSAVNIDIAVKAIAKRITDIYKEASVPLTQRLGNFCSYCEIPLPGLVEVEHVLPKSYYPLFATEWTNFLMSCGPCNTQKSNTPDRVTVAGWIGKANPTEAEYQTEIRTKHYIWPDIDPSSYRALPCELWYNTGTIWQRIDTWHAADYKNHVTSMSIPGRSVKAKIYTQIGVLDADVQVRIAPSSSTATKATEIINLCGLNYLGDPTSTYDRRVVNRTMAWFTVTMAAGLLENVTTQAEFDLMWPLILSHAQSTGFYSVWVTIFNTYHPNTDLTRTLAQVFVNDSDKPLYFPNTNKTQVP